MVAALKIGNRSNEGVDGRYGGALGCGGGLDRKESRGGADSLSVISISWTCEGSAPRMGISSAQEGFGRINPTIIANPRKVAKIICYSSYQLSLGFSLCTTLPSANAVRGIGKRSGSLIHAN